MDTITLQNLSPLMQSIIRDIIATGAGDVVIASDGHIFVEPGACIDVLYGVLNERKEGIAAGEHIVMRRVRKRAKNSKYAGMPWYQLYALPIVKKNAETMTDAERSNIEMNTEALRMAHAVERDPEQRAAYTELHEAHKRNPEGYKKVYPNLFGFLVATFRMQLEAEQAQKTAEEEAVKDVGERAGANLAADTELPDASEKSRGNMPCAVVTRGRLRLLRQPHTQFRRMPLPFIRLPIAA